MERAVKERLVEPEPALERRGRAGDAALDEQGRRHPGVRRPAAMETLDGAPRAVRLDDAAGHARRDGHGVADRRSVAADQQ